jgi:uncharacterized protein (DUF58 family)
VISKDLLKKLKTIELCTARLVDEQVSGSYHSVFRGSGMAFAEARPYQPGDNVRWIDWNVSARMNEPWVKVFTEEREMTVMLVVDVSASQWFGSFGMMKVDLVSEIAALFAFSAIKNQDRVGLLLGTDRVEKFVPPKKGRAHVLGLIAEILQARPQSRETDLSRLIAHVSRVLKRRSLIFVISDFLDGTKPLHAASDADSSGYAHALRVCRARHDVVPVVVSDPHEATLPEVGLVLAEDAETGQPFEIDTNHPSVRARYAESCKRLTAQRDQLFRTLQLDVIRVDTTVPYIGPIRNFFRTRQQRSRGRQ